MTSMATKLAVIAALLGGGAGAGVAVEQSVRAGLREGGGRDLHRHPHGRHADADALTRTDRDAHAVPPPERSEKPAASGAPSAAA